MAFDARDGHGPVVAIPDYLVATYDWAYVQPKAVRLFERQWLVNLILWGNFSVLRDGALRALGAELGGTTLQIACVYGDLTQRLLECIDNQGQLDVIDVLPIQLRNLVEKLHRVGMADTRLRPHLADSAALPFDDASRDRALLFFLLHEQPEEVRRKTLAEAFRVVRPGGKIVIVDYHQPRAWHPLRLPMLAILSQFEPFALDLWRHPLSNWFPTEALTSTVRKSTFFGGLYQMLEVVR